jgi:hypothetical protein
MFKSFFILIIGVLLANSTFAQEKVLFKKSMMDYNKHLAGINSVSLELEYFMYLDKDMSKPISSKNFHIYQSNKKVFARDKDEVEYYSNDTAIIVADLSNKFLMLIPKDKKAQINFGEFNSFLEMNFDTLTKGYDSILVKKISADVMTFYCKFKKKAPYTKVSITYNSKKQLVERVIFHYREKMVIDENKPDEKHYVSIEINYKNYNFSFHNIDKLKSIASYITKSNGKIGLTENYKSFKLINEYYGNN